MGKHVEEKCCSLMNGELEEVSMWINLERRTSFENAAECSGEGSEY